MGRIVAVVGGMLVMVMVMGGAACAAPAADLDATDQRGQTSTRIIHGVKSGTEHDAVVLLSHARGWSCTASMVAPNLILTAAHCVAETEAGGVVCDSEGNSLEGGAILEITKPSEVRVFLGPTARAQQMNGAPAAAMGRRILTNGAKNLCGGDIAFVVLDRSLPAATAPIAPLRTSDRIAVGEKLTAVGWGLAEDGELPLHRMSRAGIAVTRIGPAEGLPASDFEVAESICSGDSGGPIFSADGAIVGVVSRGGGGDGPAGNAAAACIGPNARDVYVAVSREKELVDEAFAVAGGRPVLETPTKRALEVDLTWGRTTKDADYSLDVQLSTGDWLFPCVSADLLKKKLTHTFDGSCPTLGRTIDLRSIKAFRICWAENDDWPHASCAAMPYDGVSGSVAIQTTAMP